jgi:hypothetical protein
MVSSQIGITSAFEPDYFDPLSTADLTITICGRFEEQPLLSLEKELPRFQGSGLYALYYCGASVDIYHGLAAYKVPVYVGQARSHASATGKQSSYPDPLWRRVRNHRESIEGAGLPLVEFGVRLLRMPDVHCDLGENGLRVRYQPVWNSVLNGFGSKEQGSSTRKSGRSKWDTVHRGRNRTFGEEAHDEEVLRVKVRQHIKWQIARYADLPWHKEQDL